MIHEIKFQMDFITEFLIGLISADSLKIIIKSKINSWTLNFPTGPNKPKDQILFHKKSQPQEFFRRTLPETLKVR